MICLNGRLLGEEDAEELHVRSAFLSTNASAWHRNMSTFSVFKFASARSKMRYSDMSLGIIAKYSTLQYYQYTNTPGNIQDGGIQGTENIRAVLQQCECKSMSKTSKFSRNVFLRQINKCKLQSVCANISLLSKMLKQCSQSSTIHVRI